MISKKLLNKLMEKNRSAHIGYVDRNVTVQVGRFIL